MPITTTPVGIRFWLEIIGAALAQSPAAGMLLIRCRPNASAAGGIGRPQRASRRWLSTLQQWVTKLGFGTRCSPSSGASFGQTNNHVTRTWRQRKVALRMATWPPPPLPRPEVSPVWGLRGQLLVLRVLVRVPPQAGCPVGLAPLLRVTGKTRSTRAPRRCRVSTEGAFHADSWCRGGEEHVCSAWGGRGSSRLVTAHVRTGP